MAEQARPEQARPEHGFETRCVHVGQEPDPATGAVVPPLHLTTTFTLEGLDQPREFEYSRTGNPTRAGLERCLASLEGADHGFTFASGMAAADAVLRLVPPGAHVVLGADSYGGTYRLLNSIHSRSGITFSVADLADADALAGAWRESTAMVWVESPGNPDLTIVDIAEVADASHQHGALCVVDNTVATPYLQRPLELGADLVVHSTTKYLSGHSDALGGFVATRDADLASRMALLQRAAGAVLGPFECYLTHRGIKTLALRMERHCATAAVIAEALCAHPAVGTVLYPGLTRHAHHHVAARQMRAGGGIVSFTLVGGEPAVRALVSRLRLFALAASLGAVESLVEHPATMSRAAAAGTALAPDPALVRLSVGIETAADLVADLTQALDSLKETGPA